MNSKRDTGDFEELQARHHMLEHYLDDPNAMARFRSQLLAALRDPTYVTYKNIFDWKRFALEFSEQDFDPSLDIWGLRTVIHPHFAQGWFVVPRSRIWWLIRLVMDVESPLVWLQRQQLQKKRGEMVRIANKLDCFAVTNTHLVQYLNRHKPSIPPQFQTNDSRVLVLQPESPASAWGLAYQPSRRRRYAWRVKFCEALEPMPNQIPPIERSLQVAVETMLKQYNFVPDTTLFYPHRFISRETGRLMWRGLKSRDIERLADTTRGPMLVEGWDEDGWPIGHRVAAKSS